MTPERPKSALRRRASWLARALGWGAFVALVLGLALDHTRLLDRAVVALLRARLGALGGEVSLVHAELEWLERTLVLRGLALDLGRREVYADTLRLLLEMSLPASVAA